MKIIYQDQKRIIAITEPQCRIIHDSYCPEKKYYLSFPYLAFSIQVGSSLLNVACSPKPIIDICSPFYGLPLPCIGNLNDVCNIPVNALPTAPNLKIYIKKFWETGYNFNSGYHWYQKYLHSSGFMLKILKMAGMYEEDFWDMNKVYKAWEKLSKKNPEFILEMDFLETPNFI